MASHPNRAMVMKNDVSNISVLCMTYMCAPFFPSWNQLVWFNVFNVVMVNHFLKAKKTSSGEPSHSWMRQSAQVITMTAGFRQSLTILAN